MREDPADVVDRLVSEAIDGDGLPAGDPLGAEASRRAADLQLTHALLTHALDPQGMAEERAARMDVLMQRLGDPDAAQPGVVARIGWRSGARTLFPRFAAAACLLLVLTGMWFFFSSSDPVIASETFARAEQTAVESTDRQYRLRYKTRVPGSDVTIERVSDLEMRGDDRFVYRGRFDGKRLTVIGADGHVTVMEDGRVVKTVPDRAAARLWLRLRVMPMPFFTMHGALSEFRSDFDLSQAAVPDPDASLELLDGRRRGRSRLEPELARVWIDRSTGVVQRLQLRWSDGQLRRFDAMRRRLEASEGRAGERSQMLRQLRAIGEPIVLEIELVSQSARPAAYYTADGQRRASSSGGL